jgi:hypothetical protein
LPLRQIFTAWVIARAIKLGVNPLLIIAIALLSPVAACSHQPKGDRASTTQALQPRAGATCARALENYERLVNLEMDSAERSRRLELCSENVSREAKECIAAATTVGEILGCEDKMAERERVFMSKTDVLLREVRDAKTRICACDTRLCQLRIEKDSDLELDQATARWAPLRSNENAHLEWKKQRAEIDSCKKELNDASITRLFEELESLMAELCACKDRPCAEEVTKKAQALVTGDVLEVLTSDEALHKSFFQIADQGDTCRRRILSEPQ